MMVVFRRVIKLIYQYGFCVSKVREIGSNAQLDNERCLMPTQPRGLPMRCECECFLCILRDTLSLSGYWVKLNSVELILKVGHIAGQKYLLSPATKDGKRPCQRQHHNRMNQSPPTVVQATLQSDYWTLDEMVPFEKGFVI